MKVRNLCIAVFILLPAVLASGCLYDEEGRSIKYYDPLGGEVVLDEAPRRIVTLSPALTETVFALDAGDLLVATDEASNYPSEVEGLPDVFSYLGLNLEALISEDPDLVIMDKTLDISEEAYHSIKDVGIPVYRIYPTGIEDVLEALIGIGKIIDREDEADELVQDIEDRSAAVRTTVSGWNENERPKVLLVSYYDGTSDPWVSTDTTMAGGLIETAGGINAVSDDKGIVVQVPVETIVGADPDIIICTQSTSWPTPSREVILSDGGWEDIEAVLSGSVYDIDGDIVDRTGPRLIQGLEEVHSRIYGYIEG
ncbi:MAG: ABC transporter substrate-binding protein [Candidatus Thermoplasmatota archaeon]|nr:ABC transporter substrate-binding protein [Candidatus Thermoplasmatota archaeon]